ncbi:unnamed protein product, partial [Didymodactylos carnosus]
TMYCCLLLILSVSISFSYGSHNVTSYSSTPSCTGVSTSDWKEFKEEVGIYIDVDTTPCNFQDTPMYFTSIAGKLYHWKVSGVTAIYDPKPTGFRIYLAPVPNIFGGTSAGLLNYALKHKWQINWMGVGAYYPPLEI